MDILSPKRLKFAQEYLLNGGNGTKAAITAGYSKKTAHAQASRLLKDVKIKDYIVQQQVIQQEEFAWSKAKAFEALERILEATNMDNNAERKNYISALQEINKLFGTYEPDKIDHTVIEYKFKIGNEDENDENSEKV